MHESAEVAQNQMRAFKSWLPIFDEIIYFGPKEECLESPKTEFIECEPFPHISTLAMAASVVEDFVCIINADIVVGSHLPSLLQRVRSFGGVAVTSRRWQFNGAGYYNSYLTDWGADFFGATPDLWRKISQKVPRKYRIGHNCWDTWVMAFLNATTHGRFFNLTRQKVIFHPIHKERKRIYDMPPEDDNYTRWHCGFPGRSL